MNKLAIVIAATAGFLALTPVASNAQIAVDTPVGGVRIGEPGYRHHDRGSAVERRGYREREVGMRGGCKTITIQRDDGSVKRIRKCSY